MKNNILIIALCTVFPLIMSAQKWGAIEGEGEIVKQEVSLETITGVQLGFSGDIILTQGTPQKIVMEGQQNILDNIKREVRNEKWNVQFDKSVRNAKPVKIHITLATLTDVAVNGSGSVMTTNTFQGLEDVDLAISGSGEISLKLEGRRVETAVSGSGDVTLEGTANTLEVAISGSGDVDARELQTGDCEVAISGSGDAVVFCSASLEVAISGSGDVRYRGNAPQIRTAVHGSGDVREIE